MSNEVGKSQSLVVLFQPEGVRVGQNSGGVSVRSDLSPQIEEAGWSYVGGWTGQGGSKLGTKR